MTRISLALCLFLSGCAQAPVAAPRERPPVGLVKPTDTLQGRWSIVSVAGRPTAGLWLELGGEGPVSLTRQDNAIFVGAPQPPTRAHLGCNDWRLNGWTSNGGTLSLGVEASIITERGCDPEVMEIENLAHTIMRRPMTMEMTSPDHLRLINGFGSVDLVRQTS